jgi:hypothetical protein
MAVCVASVSLIPAGNVIVKFMWRTTTLMLVLILSPGASFPRQAGIRPQAKLVHRYEERCGYSCAQELAIDLGGEYGTHLDDTVVVRLCSKEPLPVALSTSAADYGYAISILQGSYLYTPERILLSRSEGCAGPNPSIAATEFWVIPKGAELPSSLESVEYSHLKMGSLGSRRTRENARGYKETLEELSARLRGSPGAVGVIVGYYYYHPSRLLKQRLGDTRKMLELCGLPEDRYFVRLAPWTGEVAIAPRDPEPTYPSVFIVEIEPNR